MSNTANLSMGWFCPTLGDTSAFGDPSKAFPQSMEHFERVTRAAENAGFDYMLVPVTPYCWDAWVAASFVVSRTSKIKALVASQAGLHPSGRSGQDDFLLRAVVERAASTSTLLLGLAKKTLSPKGNWHSKEARYDQLEEEVVLIKRLLSEEQVQFSGKYYHVDQPVIIPKSVQKPYPPFFLGGGSEQAAEISARHSAVHLFWGDYPERIGEQIKEMRARAAKYGRENELRFAMRLQIVCRETEDEAWEAAHALVAGAQEWKEQVRSMSMDSIANRRQQELSQTIGSKMTPHLWTGITEVRPGAGVAVVGNPQQVAAQLMEFVDAGCSGFCLSGYPHHEEAERFGRLVMPLLMR